MLESCAVDEFEPFVSSWCKDPAWRPSPELLTLLGYTILALCPTDSRLSSLPITDPIKSVCSCLLPCFLSLLLVLIAENCYSTITAVSGMVKYSGIHVRVYGRVYGRKLPTGIPAASLCSLSRLQLAHIQA